MCADEGTTTVTAPRAPCWSVRRIREGLHATVCLTAHRLRQCSHLLGVVVNWPGTGSFPYGAKKSSVRPHRGPCAGVGEGLPAGLRRSCPGPIAQRHAIHRTATTRRTSRARTSTTTATSSGRDQERDCPECGHGRDDHPVACRVDGCNCPMTSWHNGVSIFNCWLSVPFVQKDSGGVATG